MGIMLTPSFSPEFGNNPGYTTFEIKNGEIWDLQFTFLNLTKTYGEHPVIEFNEISAEKDLKMSTVNSEGIKYFFDDLKQSSLHYAAWREFKNGFGKFETKGDENMAKIGILDPKNPRSKYFCFS